MGAKKSKTRCQRYSPNPFCADCARPISPARTVNESLLDIAMRAISCVTKSHDLQCACLSCSALSVTARALIAERHKEADRG